LEREPDALRGRWSVRADALSRPLGLAATLLAEPRLAEIRGRLDASGRCRAGAVLESLDCSAELSLRSGHAFGVTVGALRARGRVEPLVDPLALDASLTLADLRLPGGAPSVDELQLRARGTLARLLIDAEARGAHEQLRLAGAVSLGRRIDVALDRLALVSDRRGVLTTIELRRPTRVSVGEGEVEIAALSLAVADGRLDLDGRLGFGPGTSSDLRLDVEALSLARLDPLVPGPSLAGRLSLHSALTGALPEPSLQLGPA